MGVQIRFNRTCDRCSKPFDQRQLVLEEGLPVITRVAWTLTHGGKQVFSFADLCPSCEGVVGKLVKRFTLDDDEKDEKKNEEQPVPQEKAPEVKKDEAVPNVDELTKPNVKEGEAADQLGDDEKDHPF